MKKELVSMVNKYIADLGVSYIKTHNLHWNVTGFSFKSVHEYLESVYDLYSDYLDDTAEHLRKNNELPLASLKDFLAVTGIKELDSKEVPAKDAMNMLLDDVKYLKDSASAIRSEADADGDFELVSLMEDHIGDYSKIIWFVSSMLK